MADPDFVEPDDDQVKDKEAASLLVDYLRSYKENPSFIENFNDITQAAQDANINKKIPLPLFARNKLTSLRKVVAST